MALGQGDVYPCTWAYLGVSIEILKTNWIGPNILCK